MKVLSGGYPERSVMTGVSESHIIILKKGESE